MAPQGMRGGPGVANVVLLGCGAVGRALARQILEKAGPRVRIIAMADSKGSILAKGREALSSGQIRDALAVKESGGTFASCGGGRVSELVEALPPPGDEQHNGVTIVADCTADDTAHVLLRAAERGFRVASANKKPFADAPFEVFARLTRWHGTSRFESTAGACTPMVAAAMRLRACSDHVHAFKGAMSGTLGFLLSALQPPAGPRPPLSEALAAAVEGGYTEPDCRDDLSGVDVARKAVILARVLGRPVELSQVDIEALYPPALADVPYDEFERRVCREGELDAAVGARVEAALGDGQVLRYAAEMRGDALSVGLVAVPPASPLGALAGTANLVEFHSEVFAPQPLVLQGCGAGGDATAAGVLADIVELAHTSPLPPGAAAP